jgi:DNA-binding MarR family transcriptional regulator
LAKQPKQLSPSDYRSLADFRYALRRFLAFSEAEAAAAGLTPQQHQALLAIRAAPAGKASVGYVAERLVLKPHSATGLINRLAALGMIERSVAEHDRRFALLGLTEKAREVLEALTAAHREEVNRVRPMLIDLLAGLDRGD